MVLKDVVAFRTRMAGRNARAHGRTGRRRGGRDLAVAEWRFKAWRIHARSRLRRGARFSDRMDGDAGYGDLLRVAHEVSAVTVACLLTRRRLFLEVGGFDGQHFASRHHDVDYCLRLRARGQRIVQTPHAKLLRIGDDGGAYEPAERRDRETRDLRAIWGEVLAADPYYNPLLSLDPIPFTGLAWPPRPNCPRQNFSLNRECPATGVLTRSRPDVRFCKALLPNCEAELYCPKRGAGLSAKGTPPSRNPSHDQSQSLCHAGRRRAACAFQLRAARSRSA